LYTTRLKSAVEIRRPRCLTASMSRLLRKKMTSRLCTFGVIGIRGFFAASHPSMTPEITKTFNLWVNARLTATPEVGEPPKDTC
jgi:hypothetical protein